MNSNNGYAVFSTALGNIRVSYEGDAVTELYRTAEPIGGEPTRLTEQVHTQLAEYFAGVRRNFDFRYMLRGTPFQKRVWQALCEIPYGQTRTYGQIAMAIGNPRACRAVGMANHCNPIHIVVPCHRVVGANGNLTGYAGGVDMKRFLLNLETNYYKKEN